MRKAIKHNKKHYTSRKAARRAPAPVAIKMKIKRGDQVMLVSGKDKGKTGQVVRVMPKEGKVLVEGINVHKRHTRAVGNQSGRIVEKALPVNVSNVMFMDPKEGKPTRVKRALKDGKLVRVAHKSGTTLA